MLNNLQCIKWFDRKFIANSLRNYRRCPKCRCEYLHYNDARDKFANEHVVRSIRPMLLPCGHNMCENCVYQNLQHLVCNTCSTPVQLSMTIVQKSSSYCNVRENLDMNFFLLGEIQHIRYYKNDGSANTTLVASIPNNTMSVSNTMGDLSAITPPPINCNECELVAATGKCSQCKVYLCKRCFDLVHQGSKVLKLHTLQRLDREGKRTDLQRLLKPYICKRHQHKANCYCPTCDYFCCSECARNVHQKHGCHSLRHVNKLHVDEVAVALENVKSSRDNIRQAFKDVKFAETQLEDYATKTLEEISDYFLMLHSHLQLEENKILTKFREMSQQPQFLLRRTYVKLNESQETLNAMESNLERYQRSLPVDIHVGKILEKYNDLLKQIPCEVSVTKPMKNPFNFEAKQDATLDIRKFFKCSYNDPKLTIEMRTFNDDSSTSLLETISLPSSGNMSPHSPVSFLNKPQRPGHDGNQKKKTNRKQLKKKNSELSGDDMMAEDNISLKNSVVSYKSTSENIENNLVRVTYIKSPHHFYVQRNEDLDKIRKISNTYLNCNLGNRIPKSIVPGYCYMVYNPADKMWYRSILKKVLPNDKYNMFLMDVGGQYPIPKDMVCDMVDDKYMSIPPAALRCAIANIVPAGEQWTIEATNLLRELLDNKPAQMSIIERMDNANFKIDLRTDHTKSVRESFLYSGLARKRPGVSCFRMQSKAISINPKVDSRITRKYFQTGEVLMVIMLHIEGPHEFYVIKDEQFQAKLEFLRNLNDHYVANYKRLQQIYLASEQGCCAVYVNEVWHRATIENVTQEGTLRVRLVDEGRTENINWRQAFVLEEEFRKKPEFAIRCTLADIEPLQQNSYVYTESATKQFMQITSNPFLRMEILDYKQHKYRVVLYVNKRNMDFTVGEVLVKSGHGISSGETTQIKEFPKLFNNRPQLQDPEQMLFDEENTLNHTASTANDEKSITEKTNEPISRSPIAVTHLVNPGEFYVQLSKLTKGTKEFHSILQETQNKKFPSFGICMESAPKENREWLIGDHCLVYCKYDCSILTLIYSENCEWYRGIIIDVEHALGAEQTFTVFLRDIGATIRSIVRHQLFSIDPQLDRVTNAACCCHLAGCEPTGGVKSWSKSSIDNLSDLVESFDSLSISLHGRRPEEFNSFPVVLWGATTETTDPLLPCITKHCNINNKLIDSGFAHRTGPVKMTHNFEQIQKLELKEGEITLQQWFKTIEDNSLLNAIQSNNNNFDIAMDNITDGDASDSHPLDEHLTEIGHLEPTTGTADPSNKWKTSKVINKTMFNALVTYIDYGCIAYFREASDTPFLHKLNAFITAAFEGGLFPQPAEDYEYTVDQPCIAIYHLDKRHYRVIISKAKNEKGQWEARFVDYGNVENVEAHELRPYAPFPGLPALANKRYISGIQPNKGRADYTDDELAQMHHFVVDQLISVRLLDCEPKNSIGKCLLRIGTQNISTVFVEKGWASIEKSLPMPTSSVNTANSYKSSKSQNPLGKYVSSNESDGDYEVFDRNTCAHSVGVEEVLNDGVRNQFWDLYPKDSIAKIDHFLNDPEQKQPDVNNSSIATIMLSKSNVSTAPPRKKRMFDDYTQMVNGDLAFDSVELHNSCDDDLQDEAFCMDNDDGDIIEISHSFGIGYWQSASVMNTEEELSRHMEKTSLFREDKDIESEFENFNPDDSSTFLSQVTGMDKFNMPKALSNSHGFECEVISIKTACLIGIRCTDPKSKKNKEKIKLTINEAITAGQPLTQVKSGTVCLARFSKDSKWYRALIQSHNKHAKTVDVYYVDYLNSETVPLKYVRDCPEHILRLKAHSFLARLHGVEANSNIRTHEIHEALYKVVAKKPLLGVIQNLSSYQENKSLLEISLYKSEDYLVKDITICEHLIKKCYYLRK